MKLCLPVVKNEGIKSKVFGHFGSAPMFLIADTETLECEIAENKNLHHAHGMCMPLMSLAGRHIDAIVVGGIGMGALIKLRAAGIQVFIGEHLTVESAVNAFKAGSLRPVDDDSACSHHGHEDKPGHGNGCGHDGGKAGNGHGYGHGRGGEG